MVCSAPGEMWRADVTPSYIFAFEKLYGYKPNFVCTVLGVHR